MRLPHNILFSKYFLFGSCSELISAVASQIDLEEVREIRRLNDLGLPPVSSADVLSAMMGVNPGIIWSFQHKTPRYYRQFAIKSGAKIRIINAPRIGLKIVQKWLSHHLQQHCIFQPHVYGFIPGRSHIQAAAVHCQSSWVASVDLQDFFPSIPAEAVLKEFERIGYSRKSAELLTNLTCLRGFLAQGSPCSPVLSNMVFEETDLRLHEFSRQIGARLTRYADDIVYSGTGSVQENICDCLGEILKNYGWKISSSKTRLDKAPNRLKVHGLLVHGKYPRLTKGYRNKIRAFQHLISKGRIKEQDLSRIKGHLKYAESIEGYALKTATSN